jgi:hypothetical protein
MDDYSLLYQGNELPKIREGFDIFERALDNETLQTLDLQLYGLVTSEAILMAAKEAIAEVSEEFLDESEIKLGEIAVSIPLSGTSSIDALLGSGLRLLHLEFVYEHGDGEGVREGSFTDKTSTLNKNDMTVMAIAAGTFSLDKFLQKEGTKSKMTVNKVQRDEEATVDAPHTPEPEDANMDEPLFNEEPTAPPAASTPPAAPGVPKQTSLKISTIVENFLG